MKDENKGLIPQHNSEQKKKQRVICTKVECNGECGECNHMEVVGVDEKKKTETVTVDNTPKFTEANKFRMRQWSDRDRDSALRFLHSLDSQNVNSWRTLFEIVKDAIVNQVRGDITGGKLLSRFYLIEKDDVSEGEPNQEELFKEMIKIYEDYRMPSGFYNSKEAREKVLNLYHIQKLKP